MAPDISASDTGSVVALYDKWALFIPGGGGQVTVRERRNPAHHRPMGAPLVIPCPGYGRRKL